MLYYNETFLYDNKIQVLLSSWLCVTCNTGDDGRTSLSVVECQDWFNLKIIVGDEDILIVPSLGDYGSVKG